MFTATMWCDIRLGDVGSVNPLSSLKAKRSVVRPILAELRRRYDVAVAEVGAHELYRRTEIGVAAVAATAGQAGDVLDACERFVAGRPDIVLLSVRRQLLAHTDDVPGMTIDAPREDSSDG
ncbi:MAG: DUF503 domain-containing protein [Geodermatophilaceae bacterium]|nr:DUF503 domain-containing protein [Geodermatophilaceae bacterium]